MHVASSGIAVIQNPGVSTEHPLFKLPLYLNRDDNTICQIHMY